MSVALKTVATPRKSIYQGVLGITALALVVVSAQAVSVTARGYHERWDFLGEANGQAVRLIGAVSDSAPSSYGGFTTRVHAQMIENDERVLNQTVSVQLFTNKEFFAGQNVRAVGRLEVQGSYYRVKGGLYPDENTVGSPHFLGTIKTKVREQTVELLDADSAGLLLGMAYGDDSSISDESLQHMRVAGLTHLTAVSGANITLIFVLGYRSAQKLRVHRGLLITAGLSCAGLYVALVGFDGSVLRAWVMGLLGGLGMVLGHGAHRITALCTCILILLFIAPELASNFGFALSATATASLLFLAPALRRLGSMVMPGICAEVLAIPLSAALWCAPIILVLSEAFYPYTVLANVLVAPMVAPITFVGLLLLFFLGSGLNSFLPLAPLLLVGGILARTVHGVAAEVSDLPGSSVPLSATPVSLLAVTLVVAALSALALWGDYKINRAAVTRSLHNSAVADWQGL
ncbi:MAG: ComEC/Rec2 family competence protein [Rothia sp. (in: high G+C Gram-positive bacteria)]|nr:ComEC/Rec2 family competence protein [Rothia sp. (in: high G+C Gram-positive bacteria)]